MALKYASGAQTLYEGISFLIWGSEKTILEPGNLPGAYYYGLLIFFVLCIAFSFGDIENSRNLQVTTVIIRFVVIGLMIFGTSFYLVKDGVNHAPVFEWSEQVKSLSTNFGNTVFIFIYHHSVPGIIYPIRPQTNLHKMFMIANIVGALFLFAECQLAWEAFSSSSLPPCDATPYVAPCQVSPLFNENFQKIPVVGQICVFYPVLNCAAVPVLTISIRNNLL